MTASPTFTSPPTSGGTGVTVGVEVRVGVTVAVEVVVPVAVAVRVAVAVAVEVRVEVLLAVGVWVAVLDAVGVWVAVPVAVAVAVEVRVAVPVAVDVRVGGTRWLVAVWLRCLVAVGVWRRRTGRGRRPGRRSGGGRSLRRGTRCVAVAGAGAGCVGVDVTSVSGRRRRRGLRWPCAVSRRGLGQLSPSPSRSRVAVPVWVAVAVASCRSPSRSGSAVGRHRPGLGDRPGLGGRSRCWCGRGRAGVDVAVPVWVDRPGLRRGRRTVDRVGRCASAGSPCRSGWPCRSGRPSRSGSPSRSGWPVSRRRGRHRPGLRDRCRSGSTVPVWVAVRVGVPASPSTSPSPVWVAVSPSPWTSQVRSGSPSRSGWPSCRRRRHRPGLRGRRRHPRTVQRHSAHRPEAGTIADAEGVAVTGQGPRHRHAGGARYVAAGTAKVGDRCRVVPGSNRGGLSIANGRGRRGEGIATHCPHPIYHHVVAAHAGIEGNGGGGGGRGAAARRSEVNPPNGVVGSTPSKTIEPPTMCVLPAPNPPG